MLGTISNFRSSWQTLTASADLSTIAMDYPHETPVPESHTTGMTPVLEHRFTSANRNSTTRRPQGVAVHGDFIFNSWYFRSNSTYEYSSKFTISDENGHIDVCPVQLDSNGDFERVNSHGAGIMIIGDYLYLTDEHLNAVRVFCVNDIYSRVDNISAMSADNFPGYFEWIMPEVGRMMFTIPDGMSMGHISHSNNKFMFGNFYYEGNSDWDAGGDSFIWTMPLDSNSTEEFAVPENTVTTINPVYPVGHPLEGDTIERIQGCIMVGNDLIINTSWGTTNKQLIIINLNTGAYFTGNDTDGLINDDKNWLYGCEGLCLHDGIVYTVTEFALHRSITGWSLSDMLDLRPTPKTIALKYPDWYLFDGDLSSEDGNPLPSGYWVVLNKADALDQLFNGATFIYCT